MNKWLKTSKISFLVVVTLLFMNIISPLTVGANSKKNLNYLALGDSIATGSGLLGYVQGKENSGSYPALIKEDINASNMYRLTVDGMNSTQLLNAISAAATDKEAPLNKQIRDSRIITISIGSNDVLGPLLGVIAKEFDSDTANIGTLMTELLNQGEEGQKALIAKLSNLNKEKTGIRDNDLINKGVLDFSKNFPKIIEQLKTISPCTDIYVTNIYNPYENVVFRNPLDQSAVLDLGTISESYVSALNDTLDMTSLDYEVVDVYGEFKNVFEDGLVKHPLVNVDLSSYNFDPHPNASGHELIAELVVENIKDNSTNYKLREADYSTLKIFVNAKPLEALVAPQVSNNRVLVPIRAIAEEIGAVVEWDQAKNSVIVVKDDKTIEIEINGDKAYINGVQTLLDTKTVVVNNTTLIPIRFVSESLGAKVLWDSQTYTVIIKSN